jgi:hypothetical protein
VDCGIAPALGANGLDVAGRNPRGLERDLDGEVTQAANLRLELSLSVVVRRVLGELFGCALCTEVVRVRANSVVALVRPRNDDGEQLALRAG